MSPRLIPRLSMGTLDPVSLSPIRTSKGGELAPIPS